MWPAQGDHVGNVLTDLSSARQGSVSGVDILPDTNQLVRAQVPLASMLGYDSVLRKLTSGTGTFAMEFNEYQEM